MSNHEMEPIQHEHHEEEHRNSHDNNDTHDDNENDDNENSNENQLSSPLFTAKLSDTNVFINILTSIQFTKDQVGYLIISDIGIKIICDKEKILHSKTYLKRAIFSVYSLKKEKRVELCISINLLLNCISLYEASHLELQYNNIGEPLILTLEENGIITKCQIATLQSISQPMDLMFLQGNTISNKLQIKAPFLKDFLNDLEVPGSKFIIVTFAQNTFSLSVSIETMSTSVILNEESMIEYSCSEPVSYCYSVELFRLSMKINNVKQISIRIRTDGFMSITHMMQDNVLIEYIIGPHVEEDNSDI